MYVDITVLIWQKVSEAFPSQHLPLEVKIVTLTLGVKGVQDFLKGTSIA